jgi:hypothetical protein
MIFADTIKFSALGGSHDAMEKGISVWGQVEFGVMKGGQVF